MSHIPRIFVDLPLAVGEQLTLPRDKAHHLNTVLRLQPGASLHVFNGDGHEYAATLTTATRNDVAITLEQDNTPRRESPLTLTLAQGIARGDRMDFVVAKAVELGVTTIQPLFCARGKVKLSGARLQKKQTHWQRVAESAAEQSGRLICPRVEAAATFKQFLATPTQATRLLLAPEAGTPLRALSPATQATLVIGPESGFSDTEVADARAAGCQPLRLGPRILRTETAGMATLAALQSHWGDLG